MAMECIKQQLTPLHCNRADVLTCYFTRMWYPWVGLWTFRNQLSKSDKTLLTASPTVRGRSYDVQYHKDLSTKKGKFTGQSHAALLPK